jgi:LCP family protein required for cell wall assembly
MTIWVASSGSHDPPTARPALIGIGPTNRSVLGSYGNDFPTMTPTLPRLLRSAAYPPVVTSPDTMATPDDPDSTDGPPRRRKRRWFLWTVSVLLVAILGVGGWLVYTINQVSGNIQRIPGAFDDVPKEERPADVDDGSVTFLLGGLDGANLVDVYEPGAARTDTIMLAHLPDGRDTAYVVSIPRDTWIEIPDNDMGKINWAYSLGGPSLFIHTIEQLTDIRVDHLALIDWSGFEALTDAVGGVPIKVSEPTVIHKGETLEPGEHTLNGQQALGYVRERKDLPNGDFGRVQRQHNYLRSIMSAVLNQGVLNTMTSIGDLTEAIGQAARVDDGMSGTDMATMGFSMRNLRAKDVVFLTVPNEGAGQAGSQSIVVYDEGRADELWQALKNDEMEAFLAENPDLVTGEDVS